MDEPDLPERASDVDRSWDRVIDRSVALLTRRDCEALDRADPLARMRDAFALPDGVVYLDGNSLGALPRSVRERLRETVDVQWGRDLITSWNAHGWIDLPSRVGGKIARLIGAAPDEAVATDSTSVNLFKLAAAAVRANAGRKVVLTEAGDFPTDLYMLQGLAEFRPDVEVRAVEPGGAETALDETVALLLLTHVHYKTGRVQDMAGLSAKARAAGALTLWDLSHSAGVLDVDLTGAGADLAVGCGYKYLNGGPGAPAYLYVRRALQDRLRTPLAGWMGHARPFDFTDDYAPAPGVARFLCGTPSVLAMAALDAALDVFEGVRPADLQAKARGLGDLFVRLVAERGLDLRLVSPAEASVRGGQVSYAHPDGYAVMQALIARGVIGDFRSPDVIRFGFAPLYLRHADVFDAVEVLADVLGERAYEAARYRQRAAVT
jgi:kynureninase